MSEHTAHPGSGAPRGSEASSASEPRRVLVTGFEPFAGARANSSGDAVRDLRGLWTGPERLETLVLPVEFDRASALLAESIERLAPAVVIATGLAQNRAEVTPESTAVNLADARIPDNAGRQPRGVRLDDSGPDERETGLPVQRIVQALQEARIPARLSQSAGEYVCNEVFYRLQTIAHRHPGLRSGFIHLPATHDCELGPDVPTLPRAELARALQLALRTTLDSPG